MGPGMRARWLIRKGRVSRGARKSIAWALMIDPEEVALPTTVEEVAHTPWIEIVQIPAQHDRLDA